MPAVSTAVNAIDRKLHRVVLDSDPNQFNNLCCPKPSDRLRKVTEFSYQRFGKTEYSGAESIEAYVSFARELGLIDGDLETARGQTINLESFTIKRICEKCNKLDEAFGRHGNADHSLAHEG